VLFELERYGNRTAKSIAERISIHQITVTKILKKLELLKLVKHDGSDRTE
jgi:DNA-binding MarR family transcriptional regulator